MMLIPKGEDLPKKLRWFALLPIGGATLYFYFALTFSNISLFMMLSTYFFVAVLFMIWILEIRQYLISIHFQLGAFVASHSFELLIALLATGAIALSVPSYFNLPTGETNALAVSKSMLLTKSIVATNIESPYGWQADTPESIALDVKPFLFPFLLSLTHTLLGYSVNNAFLLNLLVLFLFLATAGLCAEKLGDPRLTCATVLFIVACPLFSLCARSGGVDLLAALLLGWILINLYSLLQAPTTQKFELLWMNLLLCAYVREDTFIYFIAVISGLMFFKHLKRQWLKDSSWLLFLTPLMMLPLVWQRMVVPHPPDPNKPNSIFWFGLENFRNNFRGLLAAQLDFSYKLPYPNMLHLVAIALFSYLFVAIFITKTLCPKAYQRHFIIILAGCVLARYIIVLSWWWPNIYADPISARLFLPFTLLCSLSPILFIAARRGLRVPSSGAVLALSIVALVLYHPIAVHGRFIKTVRTNHTSELINRFLDGQPDRNFLVIDSCPWRFSNFDYYAVDFQYANTNQSRLRADFAKHALREIFVIQTIPSYRTLLPLPEETLAPSFILETLVETPGSPYDLLRISRVKSF